MQRIVCRTQKPRFWPSGHGGNPSQPVSKARNISGGDAPIRHPINTPCRTLRVLHSRAQLASSVPSFHSDRPETDVDMYCSAGFSAGLGQPDACARTTLDRIRRAGDAARVLSSRVLLTSSLLSLQPPSHCLATYHASSPCTCMSMALFLCLGRAFCHGMFALSLTWLYSLINNIYIRLVTGTPYMFLCICMSRANSSSLLAHSSVSSSEVLNTSVHLQVSQSLVETSQHEDFGHTPPSRTLSTRLLIISARGKSLIP